MSGIERREGDPGYQFVYFNWSVFLIKKLLILERPGYLPGVCNTQSEKSGPLLSLLYVSWLCHGPLTRSHFHPRPVRWYGHYPVSSQLFCQVVSHLCLVPLWLLSKVHLLAQLTVTSRLRYRFPKKEWILLFSQVGMHPLPFCPGMALLEVVVLEEYCCMWPGDGMGMVEDTRKSNL